MSLIKPQQPRLVRSHPLNMGLEAAWLFNEGNGVAVYDSSERGVNPLTLTNFTGAPPWVGGNNGSALNFVSSGGLKPYCQSALASIPVGSAFTVAVWVQPSGSQDSLGRLCEVGDWSNQCALTMGNSGSGGGFSWAVKGTYTANQGLAITGQWQHVVGTFNNGTKILYVDGVPVETVTGVTSPTLTNVKATVSAYDGSLGSYSCESPISDIRIWSRCLSIDEINWLRQLTGL